MRVLTKCPYNLLDVTHEGFSIVKSGSGVSQDPTGECPRPFDTGDLRFDLVPWSSTRTHK